MEASTAKREQLETAMRRKLETELRKAREANLQQKGKEMSAHSSHTWESVHFNPAMHGEPTHWVEMSCMNIFVLRCQSVLTQL